MGTSAQRRSAVPPTPRPVENLIDAVKAGAAKPTLRGWLHAIAAPLALVAGLSLIMLANSVTAKVAAAIFTSSAVLLFGTSAVYHRGTWTPRADAILRRLDHSNIFLIIAGTYTPFALLLPRSQAISLLAIVWSGALLGVLFRVFWNGAPRWLYVPVYVLLGWVAVFYARPLVEHAGGGVMFLVFLGGVMYSLGALVYGLKRPNLVPGIFGFHELFHALTVVAFIAHFAAASMALTGPVQS